MADQPHYLGHRRRLRERFLQGGPDALPDYELLELLLFLAKPRGDMKPLAKVLLGRFGDFAGVIGADRAELAAVPGVGDSVATALKTVQAAALRMGRQTVLKRPVIASWEHLLAYCRASMAFGKTEQFRVLFLDHKNLLIADEVHSQGTVDHTAVYPREVLKRALDLGASALIMVHNHPSGDSTPSKADIAMTRQVATASQALGLALHDHVIITRSGHTSLKTLGLL